MNNDLLAMWAARWGVSEMALLDLRANLGELPAETGPNLPAKGESRAENLIQADIRLQAPRFDMTLWRNNVGALQDERGVPVRYGLANDTKQLNKVMKSGDLIGWQRELITADMVGQIIARFVSIECKAAGWVFNPKDDHQVAQKRWRDLVLSQGGKAFFSTGGLQ